MQHAEKFFLRERFMPICITDFRIVYKIDIWHGLFRILSTSLILQPRAFPRIY